MGEQYWRWQALPMGAGGTWPEEEVGPPRAVHYCGTQSFRPGQQ
jgi:hypothetical protein